MKLFAKAAIGAAAAALALAGSAQAAVTLTTSTGPIDYGQDLLLVPNSAVVCDFDSACSAGFSFTQVVAPVSTPIGSSPNITTAPPADGTRYASIGDDGVGSFQTAGRLTSFSFFFGSPDAFNAVQFLDSADNIVATFAGAALTNGLTYQPNGWVGYRAFFTITGPTVINEVRFLSGNYAFEIDRIAATAAAVPEPATWATMIMGFFGLGALLRRRQGALRTA